MENTWNEKLMTKYMLEHTSEVKSQHSFSQSSMILFS